MALVERSMTSTLNTFLTGANNTTLVSDSLNGSEVGNSTIAMAHAIPVGIILSSMILCTAAGNLLVVTAVIKERQLHTLANRLVASLAITDLMVGVLVLPLAAASVIVKSWPFGPVVCDFFITMDVLLCTNSILHLVAIAVDRYWTVTDITYTRGNKRHQYFFPVMVSATWFLSAAVCVPPFFGWRTRRENTDNHCIISQDKGYTIYSTLSAFYVPLLVIIIIYTKIFQVVRARVRRKQFTSKYEKDKKKSAMTNSSEQQKKLLEESGSPTQNGQHDSNDSSDIYTQIESTVGPMHSTVVEHKPNGNTTKTVLRKMKAERQQKKDSDKRKRIAQKRERKALRTLLMVTGIFVSCWLPFFIFAVMMPFCGDWCHQHIPKIVEDLVTWLGYSNSMLNPIIYTIFSPDFRTAFRKILCGQCL